MPVNGDHPPRWLPWGLFALAVLVHALTWWGDFAYDDFPIIVESDRIHSPDQFHRLWTESHWERPRGDTMGNWRPLTLSTFALNWWVSGGAPWSFHLINTLLHGAVTLVLFFLARAILRSPWPAALAAALFAVHPLHTEAVANTVGRSEILAALFALMTWRAHRRGHPARATLWLALGLLSKESAITVIGVMALDDWLGRPGEASGPQWRLRDWVGPLLVVPAYLTARWAALGQLGLGEHPPSLALMNPLLAEGTGWITQWATAIRGLGLQWWLFVWPADLVADYSWRHLAPSPGFLDPPTAVAALSLLGLAFLAIRTRRHRPEIALSLGLWFLTALLTSNLVLIVGVLFAERLIYLPSAGMCLLVGALGSGGAVARGKPIQRALVVAWVVILAAASVRTVRRSWDWGDNLRLWQHDVRLTPRSSQAWAALGVELQLLERYPEAREALERAVRLSRMEEGGPPLSSRALEHLAGVLLKMAEEATLEGRTVRAAELHAVCDRAVVQCLAVEPGNAVATSHLAIRHHQRGDEDLALAAFRRALALAPENSVVQANWEYFLSQKGSPDG
jgi:protein O-mannosyl-transferase